MKLAASTSADSILGNPGNFSLVLGRPLYQLLRGKDLSSDVLQHVQKRMVVITMFAWLPLLVLSAADGHLLGGGLAIPFLKDIDVQVRFLLTVPLLIAAELIVHRRMRPMMQIFLERRLIPESGLIRFEAAVAAALRLRNSVTAELLLLAFVYGVGVLIIWRRYVALGAATWYATPSDAGTKLTLAGMWYGYVSLPFSQFLLCRWYFRVLIWTQLLWRISRIELCLLPAHPDRLGGIGFLPNGVYALSPIAAAHGALLAGLLANRIFYAGAALVDFKAEIAVVVIFVLCLTLGPLLVFATQLARTKREGNREYGTLAERYVRGFEAKWLHGGAPADEQLVGSADIQSLGDLSNSVEVVRTMRTVPVTRDAIIRLVGTTLAPVVPLTLTMMPLEALLKLLFSAIADIAGFELPAAEPTQQVLDLVKRLHCRSRIVDRRRQRPDGDIDEQPDRVFWVLLEGARGRKADRPQHRRLLQWPPRPVDPHQHGILHEGFPYAAFERNDCIGLLGESGQRPQCRIG